LIFDDIIDCYLWLELPERELLLELLELPERELLELPERELSLEVDDDLLLALPELLPPERLELL